MKYILPLLCTWCLPASYAGAQYYYNDVLAPQQARLQQQALAQAGIRRMEASSTEANGEPSEGFSLQQKISAGASLITTESAMMQQRKSITISTYEQGRLVSSLDSSGSVGTHTYYTYNEAGKPAEISIVSRDQYLSSYNTERHVWAYKPGGAPEQMMRIKDGTDTSYILFDYDEKGRPSAEQWRKGKRVLHTYYYYYDEAGRLTDVVSFNLRAKRLVPELLFAYRPDGRILQMTQAMLGTGNYMVWRYSYDERGLKTAETCMTKGERLLGKVAYSYSR